MCYGMSHHLYTNAGLNWPHLDLTTWSPYMGDALHFAWAALPSVAWLIFAADTPASATDVWGLIERLGLPVVLLMFFVWQAWKDKQSMVSRMDSIEARQQKREDRMADRINALEQFQEGTLLDIVKETNQLKQQLTAALNNQTEAFYSRPCFAMEKPKNGTV